jgi:predicted phage-related endonuclease
MTDTTLDRRTFLGGSDMAALVGMAPDWFEVNTPLKLYHLKTRDEPVLMEENPESDLLWFGKHIEPVIRERALERLGVKFGIEMAFEWHANLRGQHPELPFLHAELDALVVCDNGTSFSLEIKNSQSSQWGDEWTDQIPPYYLPQATAQMAVFDVEFVIFAVLKGGSRLTFYRVDRNPDMEDSLLRAAAEFWQRVEDREPSEDWLTPGEEYAFFGHFKDAKEVTETIQVLIEDYYRLGQDKSKIEDDRKALLHTIRMYAAGCQYLVDERGKKLWNDYERTTRSVNYDLLQDKWPEAYEAVISAKTSKLPRCLWKPEEES